MEPTPLLSPESFDTVKQWKDFLIVVWTWRRNFLDPPWQQKHGNDNLSLSSQALPATDLWIQPQRVNPHHSLFIKTIFYNVMNLNMYFYHF